MVLDSNLASTNVSSYPVSADISSYPISANTSSIPFSANTSNYLTEPQPTDKLNLKDILAVKPFTIDECMLPEINPIPEGAVAAKFGRSSSNDYDIPLPIKTSSTHSIFENEKYRRSSELIIENEDYQPERRYTDQRVDRDGFQ